MACTHEHTGLLVRAHLACVFLMPANHLHIDPTTPMNPARYHPHLSYLRAGAIGPWGEPWYPPSLERVQFKYELGFQQPTGLAQIAEVLCWPWRKE